MLTITPANPVRALLESRPFTRRALAIAALAMTTVTAVMTAAPRPAGATLVLAMELPALTAHADRIVVADVLSVSASWNRDHTRILTTIELGVIESWKGDAPAGRKIVVVQPGGAAGSIETIVHGMPRWRAGERVVTFLNGTGDARASVVGMAQGKRSLRFDAALATFVAEPADRGATVVARRGGQLVPAPADAPVTLTHLRASVKALLVRP